MGALDTGTPTKGGGLTEGSVTEQRMGACAVAHALRGGDVEVLFELCDLLEENGVRENARSFVLQVICELLSENGQDRLSAGSLILRHKNVIDLSTRRHRDRLRCSEA
jgi:hypothetical protein